jgi:predicted DNA-binding protein (MmcQ/YjbR family)
VRPNFSDVWLQDKWNRLRWTSNPFAVIAFPSRAQAIENLQWARTRAYKIGGKIFLTLGLDNRRMCFKWVPEKFAEVVEQEHIRPAPYVGRHPWVMLNRLDALRDDELQELIQQSFAMGAAKAPKNSHPIEKKGTVKGKIDRKKS